MLGKCLGIFCPFLELRRGHQATVPALWGGHDQEEALRGPRHCGRQQGGRTGWLSLRREQLLVMVGNRPFWMLRGSEWKGTHDSCLRGLSVRVAVTPVPEAKLFPTSPQRARRLLLGDMWNVTILHVT